MSQGLAGVRKAARESIPRITLPPFIRDLNDQRSKRANV